MNRAKSPMGSVASEASPLQVVVGGIVGDDGQGEGGKCPICKKKNLRYTPSESEAGAFALHCFTPDCVAAAKHGTRWIDQATDALIGSGVPRTALLRARQRTGNRGQLGPAEAASADDYGPAPDLPSPERLDAALNRLMNLPGRLRQLRERVGLTPEDVEWAGIGWDDQQRRYWLPVEDQDGRLLTVIRRRFDPDIPDGQKSWIWKGSKHAFVYAPFGVDPAQPVLVVGGERDCLALGALGYNVVSFTNGEAACPPVERLGELVGTDFVLLYDNDSGNKSKTVASALLSHAASVKVATYADEVPYGYDAWDVLSDDKLGAAWIDKAVSNAQPFTEHDAEATKLHELVQARLRDLRVADEARRQFSAAKVVERHAKSKHSRTMRGDEFFLDIPESAPVLWGNGSQVLWMDGEPLMICGDDGTGKSTLDHQLIACRLGIRDDLLGYVVEPAEGSVVYLAMDRPDQARRAGHRLFPKDYESDFRSTLSERLHVWRGPLPFDVLAEPDALADWLQSEFGQDVTEVHVDSLKDLANRLSDDGVGSGVNLAIQEVVSRGINWVGLHHQRKANGENRNPESLSDVYGSRWLVAGHGSVLMLVRPGERDKDQVELRQVKEPADRIPRLLLQHDRVNGHTHVVQESLDLEQVLRQAGEAGATALEVAAGMYGKDKAEVTDAEKKSADRRLSGLVKREVVRRADAKKGGAGGTQPARYWLVEEDD